MAVYDIKISGAQNEKIAKLMGDGEFVFLSSVDLFSFVLPLPPPFHLILLSLPSCLGTSHVFSAYLSPCFFYLRLLVSLLLFVLLPFAAFYTYTLPLNLLSILPFQSPSLPRSYLPYSLSPSFFHLNHQTHHHYQNTTNLPPHQTSPLKQ
jgi:hypothetical protein